MAYFPGSRSVPHVVFASEEGVIQADETRCDGTLRHAGAPVRVVVAQLATLPDVGG